MPDSVVETRAGEHRGVPRPTLCSEQTALVDSSAPPLLKSLDVAIGTRQPGQELVVIPNHHVDDRLQHLHGFS